MTPKNPSPVSAKTRRVADAPTRMFHWLFALCFVAAHLTSESEHVRVVHAALGYAMVVLLVFRLLYGWLGPRPVRWSSLGSKLQNGWTLCRSLWRSDGPLGARLRGAQNLAMVLTTVLLMALSGVLLWSGHVLYASDSEWLEEVHEFLANGLLLLVFAHLGLLLWLSVLRGSNLALPMWRGRVPGPGPDLVARPRVGLALTLLMLSLAFGVWAAK